MATFSLVNVNLSMECSELTSLARLKTNTMLQTQSFYHIENHHPASQNDMIRIPKLVSNF